MSELSESVHFWRTSRVGTREIAITAGVSGRIVASNERWTTFAPREDGEIELLVAEAPSLALHWFFAADFGLGLTFFDAGAELGEVRFVWHLIPGEDPPEPAEPRLLELLRSKGVPNDFRRLDELARGISSAGESPRRVRDEAAALLGLPAYEWLSPRYTRDTSLETIQKSFPEAEDIECE